MVNLSNEANQGDRLFLSHLQKQQDRIGRDSLVKSLKIERRLAALLSYIDSSFSVRNFATKLVDDNGRAELKFYKKDLRSYLEARKEASLKASEGSARIAIVYVPLIQIATSDAEMLAAVYDCGDIEYWKEQRLPDEIGRALSGDLIRNKNAYVRLYAGYVAFNRKAILSIISQNRPRSSNKVIFLDKNQSEFVVKIACPDGFFYYDKRSFLLKNGLRTFYQNPGIFRAWMTFDEATLAAKRLLDGYMQYKIAISDRLAVKKPEFFPVVSGVALLHVPTWTNIVLPAYAEQFSALLPSASWQINRVVTDDEALKELKKLRETGQCLYPFS